MKNHKRGALMDMGINFVFALVFIGILAGAGLIALSSFYTTYANTLSNNASLWTYGEAAAANGLNNSSTGLLNLTTQLPTVGTIAGIGLLIIVLFTAIGAFVYMGGRKE